MRVQRITPLLTIAVVVAATTPLVLARDAAAQEPSSPTGASPIAPSSWPRQNEEQLGLAPPPPSPEEPPPPPDPRADVELPAPPFGEAGELVVTGTSVIGLSGTQYTESKASSFSATFSPGLDVFVVRGVSVGVDVELGYSSVVGYGADGRLVGTTATTLGGGARLGFNVPLSTVISLYPRMTLGFESIRRTETKSGAGTLPGSSHRSTDSTPYVDGFVPLLVHPKPHFFFGVGPTLFHAFGGAQGGSQAGVERTTIGGHLVVGGWWGGTAPAAPAAPASEVPDVPPPPRAVFGEPGTWVFTGELGVITSTKRTLGDASMAYQFEPGFDVFVGSRLSLGASAVFAHSHAFVTSPGGDSGTLYDVSSFGGALRIGSDVPFSSLASVYPRVSFAVTRDSHDEQSGSSRYATKATTVTLKLFVPVLLHVAKHFFVGFGPFIAHELLRKIDGRQGEYLATQVGAGLVVGGWL